MKILLLMDLPDDARARIGRLAPEATVVAMDRKDEAAGDATRSATIILGWPDPAVLPEAAELKWLQIGSAGANRFVDAMPEQAVLTNASGVFGVPIAEHILAMLLALTRGVPAMVEGQRTKQWRLPAQRREVAGATAGILGVGDIGRETARRLKALDIEVLGVNRTGGEAPAGVDELVAIDQLDEILPRCEILISTLPGTEHTHHLLDERRLGLLPEGALVLNVGRGSTIDESAMIDALRDGRLGGAGLDVFETEPLPTESPLWSMDNVLVSPHCSGATPMHRHRLAEIFLDNLERFIAGQPLRNVVDRQWGY